MKTFFEPHVHSFYSILESIMTPAEILKTASEKKCSAVALTDKGFGHGILEFLEQSKNTPEVKPILGAEIFFSENSRFEKRPGIDGKEGTILLLAKNDIGIQNLINILSKSALEGFFEHPRVDQDLLEKNKEGLIAFSSGKNGVVQKAFNFLGEKKAEEKINFFKNIFSDQSFFLEILAIEGEKDFNIFLKTQATEKNISCVISGNPHYPKKEDQETAQVLYAIGKNLLLDDDRTKNFGKQQWFKSWEEITEVLPYFDEDFLETTRKKGLQIAEEIQFEVQFNQNLLPQFEVPQNETPSSFLRKKCEAAIPKKYTKNGTQISAPFSSEIQERLDYELEIISTMGFDEYFLIVADLIDFAKKSQIAVGPGRGSAAGSIVSFLLEITTVDPIKYELLFERFLNPERISMPDIDIDFSDERRDEVLQYVINKYGDERVSKVCTFGTLSAKAALKDIGRALDVPFAEMNTLTKILPGVPGFKLKDAEKIKDFQVKVSTDKRLEKVFELAKKVEGCIRHVSVHACAVIIGKDNLSQTVPLEWAPGTESIKITQIPYQQLEHLGLLKMDFLGLKNLSILEKTLQNIEKTQKEKIDLASIPIDDKKTFEMMGKGETTGVFQFESDGMRRYLRELKPTEFEDLVAMNALYRPGPMEYIPQYIEGKHDPASIKYEHPILEQILNKTYGIAVYQEQIMRICQDFAGFSLGEADIVRKAMGKKIPKILAQNREKFIEKSTARGNPKKLSEKTFDDIIVPFSGYGFNRSHAVCYARIAYETAYLRANFPVEFMAAMMTTDRNNTDRIVIEMNECKKMKIEVLPPSINESGSFFSIVKEAEQLIIRFGLTAIKGLGEDTVDVIISEREMGGDFKNLQEFTERLPEKIMNKKVLEALSYSGAFDTFGDRKAIVESISDISQYARNFHEKKDQGQMGLFGGLENTEEISLQLKKFTVTDKEKWEWERNSMGLFISSHPLSGLEHYFENFGTPIGDLLENFRQEEEAQAELEKAEAAGEELIENEIETKKTPKKNAEKKQKNTKKIVIHGIITSVRKITTKTGKNMAILNIEDPSGRIEVAVFPQIFSASPSDRFEVDTFLRVTGKAEGRDGKLNFIGEKIQAKTIDEIRSVHTKKEKNQTQKKTLNIPEKTDKQTLLALRNIFDNAEDGDTEIKIVFGETQKTFGRSINWKAVELKVSALLALPKPEEKTEPKPPTKVERKHEPIKPKVPKNPFEAPTKNGSVNGFVFE